MMHERDDTLCKRDHMAPEGDQKKCRMIMFMFRRRSRLILCINARAVLEFRCIECLAQQVRFVCT